MSTIYKLKQSYEKYNINHVLFIGQLSYSLKSEADFNILMFSDIACQVLMARYVKLNIPNFVRPGQSHSRQRIKQ